MSIKTEKYLQKVSQCLYDIQKLINAHIIEPIEIDKELDRFYFIEKNKLITLSEEKAGILDISELNHNLPDDLVFNNNGIELFKKQVNDALVYLSKTASRIEHQRDFSSLAPTTGIEEGPLKDFLKKYLIKKSKNKDYTKGIFSHIEEINLKNIGIKIKGNCISSNSIKNKKVFNTKEELMIYFLFNRVRNDENEYLNKKNIANEVKSTPEYIKNCISNINKIIHKNISNSTRIRFTLIENKRGYGYRLNPQTLGM